MSELNGFKERLATLISEATAAKISEQTGINPSMLHKYKKGTDPGGSTIDKILEASGFSGLWLFHGIGPKRLADIGETSNGFVAIEPLTNQSGGEVTFDQDYLKNFLKLDPATTRHLAVRDDCMAPSFNENDLVLIDTSRKTGAGVFVITMAGEPSLRQATVLLNGNIELKCENPKYPTHEISQDDFSKLEILGRVVWSGGKA